jgi:hypothetical protein
VIRSWSTCRLSPREFFEDLHLLGESVDLLLQMPSTACFGLPLDHGIVADLVVSDTVLDLVRVFRGALAQRLRFPQQFGRRSPPFFFRKKPACRPPDSAIRKGVCPLLLDTRIPTSVII